jgi:hypothetical protein
MPWNWDGSPAVLISRATGEAGNIQPSRAAFLAERGAPKVTPAVATFPMEHCNTVSVLRRRSSSMRLSRSAGTRFNSSQHRFAKRIASCCGVS